MITKTMGIAAPLYEIGPTLDRLLRLCIGDKDSSNARFSRFSRCRLCSDRAHMPRRGSLIIFDEASRIDQWLFKIVYVMLKDLRCHSTNRSKPRISGICMVFSCLYLQLLSIALSLKCVEDEHGNWRYINLLLLDHLPRASNLLKPKDC